MGRPGQGVGVHAAVLENAVGGAPVRPFLVGVDVHLSNGGGEWAQTVGTAESLAEDVGFERRGGLAVVGEAEWAMDGAIQAPRASVHAASA